MTKRLSDEEKKRRKNERRDKRKEQKAASTTAQHVKVPRPEEEPPPDPAPSPQPENLCDECLYEFGECEGHPKFAGEGDDRVVECDAYINVETVPTVGELQKKEGPTPWDLALGRLDEFGQSILNSRADDIRELASAEEELRYQEKATAEQRADILVEIVRRSIQDEGGPTDGMTEEEPDNEPDPMPPLDRFEKDETDYGICPGCEGKLKRTAYNRYNDAIRCTNPRCRQYRAIVKTVSTGIR